MTYQITPDCIACDRCRPICPTGAIDSTNGKLSINPSLCNGCVGHYSVPQCAAACPTNNGCIEVSASTLYWQSWFATYDRLVSSLKGTQTQHLGYWTAWFETYQRFVGQLDESKRNYWYRWFSAYARELKSLQSPLGV
ncbi:MAG: 4Fe-4S binding protein [Cyanobacteriota bacterium]|nr:4Fe-4S binding protein [Cyanobacteriota bacterium]